MHSITTNIIGYAAMSFLKFGITDMLMPNN